jgi:hypothetical protein
MTTPLLISIILNGILIIAIVWMAFEISFANIAGKYQKEMADLYKNRVDSLNESYEEMSHIAKEAINSNKNVVDIANHTQYKLEHCMKAIRYAEHFLKPRKAAEMYHILGQFLRFEEWKALQEENKE